MKNKNAMKILLDIVMVLLLVLMFNKNVISMNFHEIGGLVVCGLFVIHMLLNYKWIIGVTKKIFSKGLKFKARLGYIINGLLLLIMGFIGISGILISKTIFTSISSNNIFWKMGHQVVAGYGIILVGIHIGLHWGFLKNYFKKFIKTPIKVGKSLGVIFVVIIMVYGVYSMGTSNFTRWLSAPFTMSQIGGNFNKDTGDGRLEENKGYLKKKKQVEESKNEYGKGVGFKKGKEQMANGIDLLRIISVIGTYLSITLSFSIITVLLEKLVNTCYKKKKIGK